MVWIYSYNWRNNGLVVVVRAHDVGLKVGSLMVQMLKMDCAMTEHPLNIAVNRGSARIAPMH